MGAQKCLKSDPKAPKNVPKSVPKAPKSAKRPPKSAKMRPRAAQDCPWSAPRAPKSAPREFQESPKSGPEAPKEVPRGPLEVQKESPGASEEENNDFSKIKLPSTRELDFQRSGHPRRHQKLMKNRPRGLQETIGGQDPAKNCSRATKERPRVPQETPRGAQDGSKRVPKSLIGSQWVQYRRPGAQ